MGRLAVIDLARLDREEGESACRISAGTLATEAREFRIASPGAGIAADGIRLPDFDQGIGDRRATAVEDMASDPDALARRLFAREHTAGDLVVGIAILLRSQAIGEEGAHRLGRSRLRANDLY